MHMANVSLFDAMEIHGFQQSFKIGKCNSEIKVKHTFTATSVP